jgi:hypothetical protein
MTSQRRRARQMRAALCRFPRLSCGRGLGVQAGAGLPGHRRQAGVGGELRAAGEAGAVADLGEDHRAGARAYSWRGREDLTERVGEERLLDLLLQGVAAGVDAVQFTGELGDHPAGRGLGGAAASGGRPSGGSCPCRPPAARSGWDRRRRGRGHLIRTLTILIIPAQEHFSFWHAAQPPDPCEKPGLGRRLTAERRRKQAPNSLGSHPCGDSPSHVTCWRCWDMVSRSANWRDQ